MNGQTREQLRAIHAYQCVRAVPQGIRADYKPRVHGLGASVLRDGLAAALTFLEREKKADEQAPLETNAAKWLLRDLAKSLENAPIPELKKRLATMPLPDAVRELKLEEYMLATRETLRLVVWFRRAVQATFKDSEPTRAQ
ncbi:CRISPR-associated Cmr5 family protein [Myxococcus stipitatus DSM 14675]|uniref:CRISPR type III-B/RAMP module-associated protein Cmr5 n=1 Tax=Myxococcus stipitatus (strain DSM 14675 / JCM 12634 / Mx s8) TaxID=1278073 RepID=L7URG4_MYXSD|nr:type III-B CRISPR module-associated protein Cmr5 [Myxococcus stipitatus]AGC49204.1 CRISPR-associated Cmr5 family protein [Myxococcus stipitatus DSM 14675]